MRPPRSFLREMADYCTLEGHIDHDQASFDYFRSELTCMTPPQYLLTFWSRSGQSQGQGQGQISDHGWPYDNSMCCLCLKRFLEVLNSYLLFIWDTVAALLRQYKQQRTPEVAIAAGRPPPTLRGGLDLAVFLGLRSDRKAASLLSCKVEKNVDFSENWPLTFHNQVKCWP